MNKNDMSSKVRRTKEETNYLKSIELLGEQINQAYHEAKSVKLPKNYNQVNKIVVCGMGGSQLGVDIVRHLFGQEVKLPLIQVRGYKLPKFVDSETLVFLLSYSGNTEEVLSVSKEAVKRKAKSIVVTTGGKLEKFAKQNKIPAYIFEPTNNPSGQPRMGNGYTMGALLSFLKKLKLINVGDGQIDKMVKNPSSSARPDSDNKEIQRLSKKLMNKTPVIVSSEFLQGNAHLLANQINESAKQMALYFPIPELNHHLLEGLTFPKTNTKNLYFIFFFSDKYHQRNQKRYQVTQQVLAKQKIPFTQIEFKGDKVSQAMAMLTFGSLLSYQLSKLNQVDPNKIPWVKYLKRRLKTKD